MDRAFLHVASATGVDVALPIAGTGSRSFAFLIDWHIRVLLALAWLLVGSLVFAGSPANLGGANPFASLGVMLPTAAIYLLYHPVLEVAMRGRTPGKRMAGVRIVTRDGGTPSVGALLVRNVFRLIDGLPMLYLVGLVTSLISRENLRIGDMAAGTLLVHDGAASVAALDVLAGVARDTRHDPAAIDLAQELLRRWGELEPARREALAAPLLAKLGDTTAPAAGSFRDRLRAALAATKDGK